MAINRCIWNGKFRLSPSICRVQVTFVRLKSQQPKKAKRYAETLHLPKTGFPLTVLNGAAIKRELNIQKVCSFDELYSWQKQQEREKQFVLHDGPPYANGPAHVGHALNKILKDIINRYKLLQGYKIHYIPGWDCHGLPIEIKALKDVTSSHRLLKPLDIRKRARDFARKAIKSQKKCFKEWGVMADWENAYFTFDPEYEATQLEVFYKLYDKGLIYRDYMPVYWSPSSRTALAEAELEYNKDHCSKSIYVKLSLNELPDAIRNITDKHINAVIWTTTAWTLPFNQAVCYNDNMQYRLLQDSVNNEVFICEENFHEKLSTILGRQLTLIADVKGADLNGITYAHPLTNKNLPFLPSDHVTPGVGTGLVHTAPAHGHEDFKIAVKYKLPVECNVDEDGRYMIEAGEDLYGKTIGIDADETVTKLLEDKVLHIEDYIHSYPYDWRTKLPVIIRASKQWFISNKQLTKQAIKSLKDVNFSSSSNVGMISQLQSQPYWCISRQRVWGAPIPVFYHKETSQHIITKETVDHICNLMRNHGSDIWWKLPVAQLVPESLTQQFGEKFVSELEKGEDILDIWFDSGVSWATVLKDVDYVADVYIEGVDQYRGWFMTSLLTSLAVNEKPPYKQVLVHGFTTDENGNKMSKSVGNVVDPQVVIHGGKDKSVEPSFGIDVLRWWTAHSHNKTNIKIGASILEKYQNEAIFRLRRCLKFLLGNLSDFDPQSQSVEYSSLQPQDQYMLHYLHEFGEKVTNYYENYNLHKVVLDLEIFMNTRVQFYTSVIKDRCYCGERNSTERLSSLTVQYLILEILTKSLAPIAPHLAEETYQFYPKTCKGESSIFKSNWFTLNPEWNNPCLVHDMNPIFDIRSDLNNVLASESTIEYDAVLYTSNSLYEILKKYQKETTSTTSAINEILQTSHCSLLAEPPAIIPEDSQLVDGVSSVYVKGLKCPQQFKLIIVPAMDHICERCRHYTAKTSNSPCDRCLSVLANDWAV